ncbi:MAG: hypothetical protein ABF649_02330 [Bacillus sp. (in: firmicutes)]
MTSILLFFPILGILFGPAMAKYLYHKPWIKLPHNIIQSVWLSGLCLFVLNTIIFFITCLISAGAITLASKLNVYTWSPALILIAICSPFVSVVVWLLFKYQLRHQSRNKRFAAAFIGQSFYLCLGVGIILLSLLIPSQNDDSGMNFAGFIIGIAVSICAIVIGLSVICSKIPHGLDKA